MSYKLEAKSSITEIAHNHHHRVVGNTCRIVVLLGARIENIAQL